MKKNSSETNKTKEKNKKAEKTVEIDVIKLVSAIIVVIMTALFAFALVKSVKSFMKVGKFEILGDSPYEREEIINAAGIRKGEKLYAIDKDEIKDRIMVKCPYVNSVKVEFKFPNKVKITVESLAASWYVDIVGDYYALDANLRVLEETSSNKKFIDGGIPKLSLPHVKSAIVGQTLEYSDNETEKRFAEDFMKMLKMTTFKTRLTEVDIENRFEIYIQVDGSINVYMGTTKSTEAKLEAVEKALKDPKLQNCISAEIDASNPSAVYIRPVYDYGNPESETTDKK